MHLLNMFSLKTINKLVQSCNIERYTKRTIHEMNDTQNERTKRKRTKNEKRMNDTRK
jgi:hypothetical protein